MGGSGIREFEVDPRNRYYGDRNFWLLTIATINDGYTQGDGEITVSIIRGLRAEYKVGQPSTASLTVLDNDPPICMHPFPCVPVPPVPIISVERMADSIVEGEVAKFTISAEYPFSKATHPRSDLTILIRVIVVGDITLWPNQANVMLSGDKTEVLLKIPTKIGLGENMNHGSIQVRLIEDAWNYAASSTKNDPTIRVEKLVDDQDSNSPLYSVANLALMKIVSNGTVGLPTAAQGEPAIPNMQMGETEQSLVAGGKPSISIEAERNEVVEGETARFKIHATPPFDEQSAVYYALLTDTTNTNEHAQTQVTFQPGQSTVLLELNTNNGELLENNGQLLVQLLPGPGYALDDTSNTTATINVANRIDRHNQQSESNSASRFALSQMFGEATFKPINEVGNRVANSLNGQLEVGSTHNPANVVPQLIRNGGILANDGYRGWSELLGTTNFAVPLATVESSLTDITFWGRGIRNSFQGELAEADVHWFGNNSTSIFGTDALIEDTSIVGMSASISDLRSKFSMTNHEEKYLQFSSMGVYPYFGWISKDRNSELRLVSGVGKGVTKAGQTASELEHSNSVSYAFSLEGSDRLYSNDKEFGSGQAVVSVNGRIQFSRHQLSVTSSGHKFTDIHSRVTNIWLEGNNNLALTEFATINPTISLGYLENRNDRGTVRCMSLQSGATYETVSGLHLSINGGTLVPCDNGFRATSLSGSIEYVEHGTGEGMQFSIFPSMVDSHTDENNGLNSIVVDYLDDFNRANRTENQIETELKYGFGISDGTMLLTPHVSFEMSDEGNSILGIGSKVTSDSKFEFGVQLNRTSSYRNDIDTELALNGIVRW